MKAAWLRNNVPRGMCWRSAKWTIRSRVRAKSGFESLFQESTRGDVKKRGDAFGVGMPYRRVIPHSDAKIADLCSALTVTESDTSFAGRSRG